MTIRHPRSRLLSLLAGLIIGIGLLGVTSGTAHAASDYSGAVYQVELSLNCVSPTAPCQNVFGLGGVWGWIALMPGTTSDAGTGNAQITGCGHNVRGPRGGAGHAAYDPAWYKFSSATAPSPTTPTDPNGEYLFIDGSPDGSIEPFVVPATYGHYSLTFMGAFGQITIAP